MGRTRAKTHTKRKRGGQPGNTNALKHGFYSKRFWVEGAPPGPMPTSEIKDELDRLRAATQRLSEYMDNFKVKNPADLELLGRLVGILSAATTRIASMDRAQKVAQGKGDEILLALEKIHKRVLEDRKRKAKAEQNEENKSLFNG